MSRGGARKPFGTTEFRAARGMLPDKRRAVIETTGYLVPGVTTTGGRAKTTLV